MTLILAVTTHVESISVSESMGNLSITSSVRSYVVSETMLRPTLSQGVLVVVFLIAVALAEALLLDEDVATNVAGTLTRVMEIVPSVSCVATRDIQSRSATRGLIGTILEKI
jgi:hypothetical protein